jgi:hypothetical protein
MHDAHCIVVFRRKVNCFVALSELLTPLSEVILHEI